MINVRASCSTIPFNLEENCAFTNTFVPYSKYCNIDIIGTYVWSDGTDIYYSNETNGSAQYKLNKETNTWESMTWKGGYNPSGEWIWSDGTNIYQDFSRKLNKDTLIWETVTFNNAPSFYQDTIWTDGDNIYYSYGTNQYKLNKDTLTWETVTWEGKTSFSGGNIWTDGTDIYCSDGSLSSPQGKLIKGTNTWENIVWKISDGYNYLFGYDIWTDGTNFYYYYYNSGSKWSKLNKETNTWESMTWNGVEPYADRVWTDGTNVYYSSDKTYILLPTTTKLYVRHEYEWKEVASLGNGITFTINGVKYYAEEGMNWWSWIESDYNTGGYVIDDTEGVLWYGAECQVLYNGNTILGSAKIVSGRAYDHNTG